MTKYIVEVQHGADQISCLRSIQIFNQTGNHFLANAEWGCHDGVHKAWFMLDAESKDEVMKIIPPMYWKDTRITKIEKIRPNDLKEMQELLREHEDK